MQEFSYGVINKTILFWEEENLVVCVACAQSHGSGIIDNEVSGLALADRCHQGSISQGVMPISAPIAGAHLHGYSLSCAISGLACGHVPKFHLA